MKTSSLQELYDLLEADNFSPKRVKNIRFLYNLTQKEFSKLLGVKYATYITWESGRCRPSSPACAILSFAEADPDNFIENRNDILNNVSKNYGFLVAL